jgi:hypothetical protein
MQRALRRAEISAALGREVVAGLGFFVCRE